MQFKTLALFALSAVALAAPQPAEVEKRQAITEDPTQASVLSVLATALPPSLLAIAITNTDAVSSILASEFSAGQTPSWYSALPSGVKSYLASLATAGSPSTVPAETTSGSASTFTPGNSASITSAQASISASISGSLNTTTISSVHSASLRTTTTAGGASASAASTAASSSSSGGAAYPSAVVGAGIAGAIGFLGMLAL